jgi:ATP-dependent RNA helicase DDX18/HAS1
LATQTFNCAKDLLSYHNKTHGLIIGGTNKKTEAIKIEKGKIILK